MGGKIISSIYDFYRLFKGGTMEKGIKKFLGEA